MFANASGFSRQQHVSLSLRYGFNQTLQTSASGFFQPRLASRSSQPRIPDTCRISYYRTLQSNVLYYATRTKQTFSVLTISSQCSKPGSKLESTPRHVHTYICHASQGPDVQGASRVEPSEAARARGRGGGEGQRCSTRAQIPGAAPGSAPVQQRDHHQEGCELQEVGELTLVRLALLDGRNHAKTVTP